MLGFWQTLGAKSAYGSIPSLALTGIELTLLAGIYKDHIKNLRPVLSNTSRFDPCLHKPPFLFAFPWNEEANFQDTFLVLLS